MDIDQIEKTFNQIKGILPALQAVVQDPELISKIASDVKELSDRVAALEGHPALAAAAPPERARDGNEPPQAHGFQDDNLPLEHQDEQARAETQSGGSA